MSSIRVSRSSFWRQGGCRQSHACLVDQDWRIRSFQQLMFWLFPILRKRGWCAGFKDIGSIWTAALSSDTEAEHACAHTLEMVLCHKKNWRWPGNTYDHPNFETPIANPWLWLNQSKDRPQVFSYHYLTTSAHATNHLKHLTRILANPADVGHFLKLCGLCVHMVRKKMCGFSVFWRFEERENA